MSRCVYFLQSAYGTVCLCVLGVLPVCAAVHVCHRTVCVPCLSLASVHGPTHTLHRPGHPDDTARQVHQRRPEKTRGRRGTVAFLSLPRSLSPLSLSLSPYTISLSPHPFLPLFFVISFSVVILCLISLSLSVFQPVPPFSFLGFFHMCPCSALRLTL